MKVSLKFFKNKIEYIKKRLERRYDWHTWYAWRPVIADKEDLIWLTKVYRKKYRYAIFYDYTFGKKQKVMLPMGEEKIDNE